MNRRSDCDRVKYDRARSHRSKSPKALRFRHFVRWMRITTYVAMLVRIALEVWINLR